MEQGNRHREHVRGIAAIRRLCAGKARGQGLTEVALLMPVVLFILLGVIDYAQATSAQQRLERAAHLATLRLAADSSMGTNTTMLESFIERAGGFPTGTVPSPSATYSVGSADQSLRVTVAATYDYPLMMPGIRNLQTRVTSNGKLHIIVQGAGIAATIPPNLTQTTTGGHTASVTVTPPDPIAPGVSLSSLASSLTCTLYRPDGTVAKVQNSCNGPVTLTLSSPYPTGTWTATITQANGVVSAPATITVT